MIIYSKVQFIKYLNECMYEYEYNVLNRIRFNEKNWAHNKL